MNLARFLRQTITWEPATGTNSRGEATYGPAQTVPARVVAKVRDLISKDGEVTTTTMTVTLLVEPSVGDLLGGREVVHAGSLVAVDGTTVGYQALTR